MYLSDFSKELCDQLPQGSTCMYGENGTHYLVVLVPIEGRLLVVGQFLYKLFREGYAYKTEWEALRPELKQEMLKCYQAQLDGTCTYIPSVHFDDSELKVNKSVAAFETYMHSIS